MVLLLLIILAGVALRVGISLHRGEALVTRGNGTVYIHPIARNLAAGRGYEAAEGVPNVFQQPAYPLVLAGGYFLAGPTPTGVAIANTAVSVLLILAAFHLGLSLWGRPRHGLAAALLAALHPYLAWHGTAIADTTFFTLCLTAWAAGCLSLANRPSLGRAAWLGFWIGIGVLTRPSLIPLIPLGYLFLLLTWWNLGRWLRPTAVSLVVAIILVLPWCIRNYALTGEFPLLGTHGPEAMFFANSDEALPLMQIDSTVDAVCNLPKYRGSELDVRHYQMRAMPEEAIRTKAEYVRATKAWIRENPGTFARISLLRLGRMWDPGYHPTRFGERPAEGVMVKNRYHAASFVPLVLLALVGFVILLRDRTTRLPALLVLSIVVLYSLVHSMGAGYSRVRLPLDLLLIGVASGPLSKMLGLLSQVRGRE